MQGSLPERGSLYQYLAGTSNLPSFIRLKARETQRGLDASLKCKEEYGSGYIYTEILKGCTPVRHTHSSPKVGLAACLISAVLNEIREVRANLDADFTRNNR